jgi:Xaa-Pro aminopeptidase
MLRDTKRIEINRQALKDAGLDAVVCALPMNVLLLSGYWPVAGTSIAIFTSDQQVTLLVPEDEKELADDGWADEVSTFSTGSLTELKSPIQAVEPVLEEIGSRLGKAKIGFESDVISEPVSYAAMNLYGAAIIDLLRSAFSLATLVPARQILTRLRSVLTPNEIEKVKLVCGIAESAFRYGAEKICEGKSEIEIAEAFHCKLSDTRSAARAGGFTFCMSGENSYEAFAAFQLSRQRCLQNGDLALVHCNSYADGLWTDITRTYCVGGPDEKKQRMYEAVLDALKAAVEAVRPGVRASDVDGAARQIIAERGFGEAFKHGLGHAVGFHAIDHNAPPRLHPASPDTLQTGTVFNIEPAIYIEGIGGLRHCDMVAVGTTGAEILTDFQRTPADMVVMK